MELLSLEYMLLFTGGLFACALVLTFHPDVEATRTSRSWFGLVAAICVAASALPTLIPGLTYLGPVWVAPLVAVSIIAMQVRDAIAARSRRADLAAGVAGILSAAEPTRTPLTRVPVAQGPAFDLATDERACAAELATLAYGFPELRALIACNPAAPASLVDWIEVVGNFDHERQLSRRALSVGA